MYITDKDQKELETQNNWKCSLAIIFTFLNSIPRVFLINITDSERLCNRIKYTLSVQHILQFKEYVYQAPGHDSLCNTFSWWLIHVIY